jgi:hypothetical protein
MGISSIGSAANTAAPQLRAAQPQAKTAADGDSPTVEALENAASKVAEKNNGGYTPKVTQVAKPEAAAHGRVNIVV